MTEPKTRRIILVLAAFALGLISYSSVRQRARAIRWDKMTLPEQGRYLVAFEQEINPSPSMQLVPPLKASFHAELHLKRLPAEPNAPTSSHTEQLYVAQLRKLSSTLQTADRFGDLPFSTDEGNSLPFLFRVQHNGEVDQYHFSAPDLHDSLGVISGIAEAFQLYRPYPGSTSWTAEEIDSIGHYRAWYGSAGAVLKKRKTQYLSIDRDAVEPRFSVQLLKHSSELRPSKSGDEIGEIRYADSYRFNSDKDNSIALSSSIQIERLDAAISSDLQQITSSNDLEQITHLLKPDTSQISPEGMHSTLPSADELFRQLRELANNAKGTPGATLSWAENAGLFFRANPKALEDAESKILDATSSDSYKSKLFYALQRCDSPSAVATLRRLAANESLGSTDRFRSLVALGNAQQASAQASDALKELYRESADQDVRNTALLNFGASLHHLQQVDPSKAAEGYEFIAASALNATERSTRHLALQALSNSANASLAFDLEPLFTDQDPETRSKAYAALRRLDDSASFSTLTSALSRENAVGVRKSIAETLAERSLSKAQAPELQRAFEHEHEPGIRKLLADKLVQEQQKLTNPAEYFKKMLRAETDAEVYRALAAGAAEAASR